MPSLLIYHHKPNPSPSVFYYVYEHSLRDGPPWQLHSLGHQGEGLGAHGWTRHQPDHHVFTGGLEVSPRHLLQHRGQGGHVAALCARVPGGRVQDVAPVHDQQQHVRFAFSLRVEWTNDGR